jgi:hypothetical protein
MSTTWQCIKTYIGGQHWDEELQMNVQYKKPRPRNYADDAKPATEYDKAGEELDRQAKAVMQKATGTSYQQAFKAVLEANPSLKAIYGGTK